MSPIAYLCGQFEGVDVLEARKYLGMFGLDGARHLINISELSGGKEEKRRNKILYFFSVKVAYHVLLCFVLSCFLISTSYFSS